MRVTGVVLLSLCCVAPALADQPAPAADAPKVETQPLTGVSGWDGTHFTTQSPDGRFVFSPYGYVQGDYRIFTGDGVPPNTFTLRRARLGVQGKFDKYYEYALLADFVDTGSRLLRDAYINVRYIPEVQLTVGQMVEPFGQETATVGITNIDFVERGLTALLYPSAVGAYRSPGAMIHGDIAGGTVSYWLGAFNGKGPTAANTTSEPEVIGRLRIYPFKAGSNDLLKGIAVGGAVGRGRSRALSSELSFSGSVPEGAFSFFPQLAINGPILRYNGEFTFLAGPFGLRGEYDELHQKRNALGNGFSDLPEVVARGFTVNATFLLTGERRPENAQPKPKNPFLTPGGTSGIGAWEVKARYSYLWAKALGDITGGTAGAPPAGSFPDYQNSVDEISVGLNWFPESQVRYSFDVNVYRDKDAATVGGQVPQTFVVVLQRVQFKF
jgi:phosphate-selective porin OprO/OprP